MKTLRSIFGTSDHVMALSLAGLTDSAARARLRHDAGPSISWTVGHLLDFRYQLLSLLTGEGRPSPWAARFRDTSATDGSDYPSTGDLAKDWAALAKELRSALDAAPADRLDNPAGTGPHGESTVRDRVAFLAWHEGYHIGVIGACRKAVGLPGPAELVQASQQ